MDAVRPTRISRLIHQHHEGLVTDDVLLSVLLDPASYDVGLTHPGHPDWTALDHEDAPVWGTLEEVQHCYEICVLTKTLYTAVLERFPVDAPTLTSVPLATAV